MLELIGVCCGGIKAIEFMESLADIMDENVKTEEFSKEFEAALNRFRYEVAKGIGVKKKIVKAENKKYHDFKYCNTFSKKILAPRWKWSGGTRNSLGMIII